MKFRTQEQVEEDRRKIQRIIEFVPHEFCVEIVEKYLDTDAMIVEEEIVEREVNTLRTELVRDWINILSRTCRKITKRDGAPNWIGLDLKLLPWARPDIVFKGEPSYGKCKTCHEVLERQNFLNAVAINYEDVRPLFEAFVENVKSEITTTGKFALPDGLFIEEGPGLYYLRS